MSQTFSTAHELTKAHEGSYIRFDGFSSKLDIPACKKQCYRIIRVWNDGLNVKGYKTPVWQRHQFVSSSKFNQRVEVFTQDEFNKLPE